VEEEGVRRRVWVQHKEACSTSPGQSLSVWIVHDVRETLADGSLITSTQTEYLTHRHSFQSPAVFGESRALYRHMRSVTPSHLNCSYMVSGAKKKESEVVLAFPLGEPDADAEPSRFYSFLPVAAVGFPFSIHADMEVCLLSSLLTLFFFSLQSAQKCAKFVPCRLPAPCANMKCLIIPPWLECTCVRVLAAGLESPERAPRGPLEPVAPRLHPCRFPRGTLCLSPAS
jgi:hypothetical protein